MPAVGQGDRRLTSMGSTLTTPLALARSTGFAIHQLLSERPGLRGPGPGPAQSIVAYQALLARRVHYSGPVRPVDLRV